MRALPVAIAPDQEQHLTWASSLGAEAVCTAQSGGNLGQRLNQLGRELRCRFDVPTRAIRRS